MPACRAGGLDLPGSFIMIKIDWDLYIKQRSWFGWWWRHPHTNFHGKWCRDKEYMYVPVMLTKNGIGQEELDFANEHLGNWADWYKSK